MNKKWYVVNVKRIYVAHESTSYGECTRYISNACWTQGVRPTHWFIVQGAKDRDELLKSLRAR